MKWVRRILFCLVIWGSSLNAEERPNIIFILADDLGYGELGCYGQEKIKTPRIDQLATEGMKFTRAYAGNAVCAPSRCVFLTGKHPGIAEVRNNHAVKPEGQYPLSDGEITIAELLKSQGYACGIFGKWGLGNVMSEGRPRNQGFDEFLGYYCQANAHSYYPEHLWKNEEKFPLNNHPPIPGHANFPSEADINDPRSFDIFKGEDYASDRINAAALEFIRSHQEKPFFLYYASLIPHLALHVPDEDLDPYLAENWSDPPLALKEGYGYTPHFTPKAAYAAMITRFDLYVGRVLDLLDELGLAENTIVVVTSDNGTSAKSNEVDPKFFKSVGNLNGLKGTLLEGGVRVPQVVRWPGKVPAGGSSAFVTGFEDWLPTFMEVAGAAEFIPENVSGLSIVDSLLGKDQGEREFLYREFTGYGGQQAVWLGSKWKGYRSRLGRKKPGDAIPIQLYDLENDPSEKNDVGEQHPEVAKQITQLMISERIPSPKFRIRVLDSLSQDLIKKQ